MSYNPNVKTIGTGIALLLVTTAAQLALGVRHPGADESDLAQRPTGPVPVSCGAGDYPLTDVRLGEPLSDGIQAINLGRCATVGGPFKDIQDDMLTTGQIFEFQCRRGRHTYDISSANDSGPVIIQPKLVSELRRNIFFRILPTCGPDNA